VVGPARDRRVDRGDLVLRAFAERLVVHEKQRIRRHLLLLTLADRPDLDAISGSRSVHDDRAHLDVAARPALGDRDRGVEVWDLDHPEAADVLLRLYEGSFGDPHRPVHATDGRGCLHGLKLTATLQDPLLREILPPGADRGVRGRLHFLWLVFPTDRKSTRLNSSHEWISYAV